MDAEIFCVDILVCAYKQFLFYCVKRICLMLIYEVKSIRLELNCINKDQLLYVYTIIFFLYLLLCAQKLWNYHYHYNQHRNIYLFKTTLFCNVLQIIPWLDCCQLSNLLKNFWAVCFRSLHFFCNLCRIHNSSFATLPT